MESSLKKLELLSNKIKQVDNDLVSNLFNLEYLDLSPNELSQIGPNSFKSLLNLKTLYLWGNKMSSLNDTRLFRNLTLLNELSLDENEIEFIHVDSFVNLFGHFF